MPPKLRAYLESIGLDHQSDENAAWLFYRTLEGEQQIRAQALHDGQDPDDAARAFLGQSADGDAAPQPKPAEQATTPAPPDPADDADDDTPPARQPQASQVDDPHRVLDAERRRVSEIRAIAADLQLDERMLDRAIDSGESVNTFRERALNHLRNRPEPVGAPTGSPFNVNTGRGITGDMRQMALSAGMILRAGLQHTAIPVTQRGDERQAQQERIAELGDQFRSASIIDICRETLALAGRNVAGYGSQQVFRAAVSTAELDHVFTTSINAIVGEGFEAAEDTTRQWVETGEVSDFKTHDDITMGRMSGMAKHPRGGAAPHGTFDDDKETFKVARYSEQFTFDEMDAIDDRFDVLMDTPRMMVEDAAQLQPDLVYAILLANPDMGDTVALFENTNHGNDADLALSSDSLKTVIAKMRTQTHKGRNLNLRPRFLITADALRFTAAQMLNSALITLVGTTERGNANVLSAEGLTLVSDARIDNGVTDPDSGTALSGTASAWYLASARRSIRVVYRRGARTPQVDSWRTSGQDGKWLLGWAIKHDIGAYARDFRGLQRGNE